MMNLNSRGAVETVGLVEATNRRNNMLESIASPANSRYAMDAHLPLTKMVNGQQYQGPSQHRIRVPSFHNNSSQASLHEAEMVCNNSANDICSQTQATQPPISEDPETQMSPLRWTQSQPDHWGRLVPIEDLSNAEKTRKDLAGPSVFRIGRGGTSQLQINDMTVSSKHCSIVRDESNGHPCIIDHGSSNGTFVNYERLVPNKRYYLCHGDCISLVAPGNKFTLPEDTTNLDEPAAKRIKTPVRNKKFSMIFYSVPTPAVFSEEVNANAPRSFSSKYALFSEIGHGNFATVYRGMCRSTGDNVAVKVIERSRHWNMNPAKFNQQVKEAEMLRTLQHPGIVAFRDLVRTDSAMYVVTELLEGGELYDRLVDKGPYLESRARILMRNVLEAVAYLHGNGIVHRDLKPENIVIKSKNDDTDVKLVDFGVSTDLKQLGRGKTFCGSMTYVAPEVLKRRGSVLKQGSYREAVDMWSIGVIVCVVLTLRPPFDEEEDGQMHAILQQVLRFERPEWRGVSVAAKDFIAKCFELNEEKRITAKDALNHEWLRHV